MDGKCLEKGWRNWEIVIDMNFSVINTCFDWLINMFKLNLKFDLSLLLILFKMVGN